MKCEQTLGLVQEAADFLPQPRRGRNFGRVAGGADVAREGADVVLLNHDMAVLPRILKQAQRTRRIIRQNLIWASIYNLIAVPLAVLGFVTPWIAALGMSISSLIVVANALRLLKKQAD